MDATRPRIRHVRPGDGRAIAAFYAALSPESRRTRFFGACREISPAQADRFARARDRGGDGLLAIAAFNRVVGHLCLEPIDVGGDPKREEVAIAVAEAWRGRGLGRRLLDAGIASARGRGVDRLEATMLTGNQPIHALLEHSGLPWSCHALEPGSELIRLELHGAALQGAA